MIMKIIRYFFEILLFVVGVLILIGSSGNELFFLIGIGFIYAAYKIESFFRRREFERKCVQDQILFKGETPEQVLESWGEPDDYFSNSEETIWCYGPRGMSGTQYKARITFKKGVVSKFTREQKDF